MEKNDVDLADAVAMPAMMGDGVVGEKEDGEIEAGGGLEKERDMDRTW